MSKKSLAQEIKEIIEKYRRLNPFLEQESGRMNRDRFVELLEAACIVTTGALGLSFFLLIIWPSLSGNIDWPGFWMVVCLDLAIIFNHLRDGKEDE